MPTKIEWTYHTWNPFVGCSKVSPACDHCYAERMACRLATMPATAASYGKVVDLGARAWNGRTALVESALSIPLRWRKPRRVFVGSMTDLFHPTVPDEWLDRVFAVMALTPHLTFQVLTKRPERMREYLGHPRKLIVADETDKLADDPWAHTKLRWPLPNIWLGVTAEDQPRAEERIPILIDTPAAVRYVSYEPGLGAVDLDRIQTEGATYHALSGSVGVEGRGQAVSPRLDWVICGGESGPGARPMHPDWARSLRDQCQETGVSFFFKQWGEFCPFRRDLTWHGSPAATKAGYAPTEVFVPYSEYGKRVGKIMQRVGKKIAGRLLDGREWNEFPNNS